MNTRTPQGVGGAGSSTFPAPQTRGPAVPVTSLAIGSAKPPVANSPAPIKTGGGLLFEGVK